MVGQFGRRVLKLSARGSGESCNGRSKRFLGRVTHIRQPES